MTTPAPTPPPTPPGLHCSYCDYDLRSHSLQARCPECGQNVSESVHPQWLANLPTRDLHRLHLTLRLLGGFSFGNLSSSVATAIVFPLSWMGLHMFADMDADIVMFLVPLLFIIACSALTWRLTRPLLSEEKERSRWRRSARYMALLPSINLLLMIMLGLTLYYIIPSTITAKHAFASLTTIAHVLSMQFSFAIGGLSLMPLLAYVAQLARQTGYRGDELGRLAFVSAFLVPLPALITLLVLLPIVLTHIFFPGIPPAWATVQGVKTILGTPIWFAGCLATAWTSIILWLLAGRIHRLARRAAKERDPHLHAYSSIQRDWME